MVSLEAAGITQLLANVAQGQPRALDDLLRVIYPELKRLASIAVRRESWQYHLDRTGLTHEAFIRLFGASNITWENRQQFFSFAIRQMRRILIEHARKRNAARRQGDRDCLPIDESRLLIESELDLAVDIDRAVDALYAIDERAAQVVEMRFFGGLTNAEVAHILDVDVSTLHRDWEFARAWLRDRLSDRQTKRP